MLFSMSLITLIIIIYSRDGNVEFPLVKTAFINVENSFAHKNEHLLKMYLPSVQGCR